MFKGCSSLVSLDLSNFDTSNVKIMWAMFSYCLALTTLNPKYNVSIQFKIDALPEK